MIMKNIVFINSKSQINRITSNILQALKSKGYNICVVSKANKFIYELKLDICNIGQIYVGPNLERKLNQFFFLSVYLFLIIIWFFKILFSKKIKKSKIFILNNCNEKLIITPLAKFFKLKIIWLEEPDIDYFRKAKLILFLFKFLSKSAEVIIFLEKDKIKLKKIGVKEDGIKLLSPGIFLNQYTHQDSIFSTIARTERNSMVRKYFTVGIVTNFKNPNQIENLFQAIKKSVSVVPNIQLIIVGDGEERRQYLWIARKLEINNLVWFVGEQSNMRKWFDNLDIFISVPEILNLDNIEVVEKAMESKLPVIGFRNLGLEDLLDENILLEFNNSEVLAEEIIKLYKDRQVRKKIGENNFKIVKDKFDINIAIERLEKLFI